MTKGVSMPRMVRSPRERAARALCDLHGHPPDIKMDGQPMWVSYDSRGGCSLECGYARARSDTAGRA